MKKYVHQIIYVNNIDFTASIASDSIATHVLWDGTFPVRLQISLRSM